jgi:hypothetical protein
MGMAYCGAQHPSRPEVCMLAPEHPGQHASPAPSGTTTWED